MILIKNQNLIKELIKIDPKINLNDLERIDFVITETKSKTVEDCQKIFEYLNWYTEKTNKQGHIGWDNKSSFDVYHRYLKLFKDIHGRVLFPKKQDIYYLCERGDSVIRRKKIEFDKSMLKEINDEYNKYHKYLRW